MDSREPSELGPPDAVPPTVADPSSNAGHHRWRLFLIAALIASIHLSAMLFFCPPDVLLSAVPFGGNDYQTHYQQTSTLRTLFANTGRLWGYDPNMLAGFPVGLFFEVDNHAHFLFSIALERLGVPLPVAFKLFAFLICLLAPLSVFLGAQLLGLRAEARLWAFGLGSMLWLFDSGLRFCWSEGMISFVAVSHLAPLTICIFYRFCITYKIYYFILLVLFMPLLHLMHVWAFPILCLPLVALYLRYRRTLPLAGHLMVLALVLITIGANLYWLWPVLHHLDLLSPSKRLGQASPLFFLSDYLGLVLDPLHAEILMQNTAFRYLAIVAAALTLWHWRRERDGRLFVGAVSLLWLWGLTFLGSYLPGAAETEPYRFIAPLSLVAAIVAGPWLAGTLNLTYLRSLPSRARALVGMLLILALPLGVQDIASYFPEIRTWLYDEDAAAVFWGLPQGQTPVAVAPWLPPLHRLVPVHEHHLRVAEFLRTKCREEGRVLVQEWYQGELLRWATDKPIIGGFPERRTVHEASNLFRLAADPRLEGEALRDYLTRYNIRYLVMSGLFMPPLEENRDLVERVFLLGFNRVYRVKTASGYLASGQGQVSAELNRITVQQARPAPGTQELVLRFHYVKTLRCSPGCRLVPVPLPDSRAHFIKVVGEPVLPQSLVVEQTYP